MSFNDRGLVSKTRSVEENTDNLKARALQKDTIMKM